MTFSEAIKPFVDKYGLTHPDVSHSSQNGVLYSAYVLALKRHLKDWDDQRDWDGYGHTIHFVSKLNGLICRVPKEKGWGYQEGPDDFIGAICGLEITKNRKPIKRMYEYGQVNKLTVGPLRFKYFYNTDCPGDQWNSSGQKNWPAYFGRFLIFRILLKWGAKGERTWLERFIFAADCLWTAEFAKQTDDTPLMMLFLKLQALGSDRLRTRCAKILKKRKIEIKKAFELYFGPKHPLAVFCPRNPWGAE